MNDLDTLVKKYLTIFARVFFWALQKIEILLVYASPFMPVPHYSDYYSFVFTLKLGNMSPPILLILFQDCFGYSGFLEISYEF